MNKRFLKTLLSFTAIVGAFAMSGCGGNTGYRLPIVCGEEGMSSVCGVATYGVDYYSLGLKAGDMAADVLLNNANPATTAVATDPNPSLSINETVAAEIGFTIPESVKAKATGGGAAQVTRIQEAVAASKAQADYSVGIIQLVQHVALDKSNNGFIDQLSVRMKAAGKTVYVDSQNAAGDSANNTTICSSFVANNYNLIYSIATSSSQAAVEATKENNIPVIFNAVTDPVGAGLVTSFEAPGKNVTGVSDINPVAKQIDLIGELLPNAKKIKIGLLYTSAEVNSVYQINLAKAECEAKGYEYVEKGIGDINDTQNAFITLKQKECNAIYIPTDNTLANGVANVHAINKGE